MKQHVAHASVKIHARPEQVWEALTDPERVRQYMEGAHVRSTWAAGSPITWEGEHRGRPFRDHGKVLRAESCRVLEYTHWSSSQGEPDQPENHHTVMIELEARGDGMTHVTLAQDGNASEEARERSEENWRRMLNGLRDVAESRERSETSRGPERGGGSRGGDGALDHPSRDPDAWSGPERARAQARDPLRGQERHRDKEHDRKGGRNPDRDRW